MLDLEEEEQKSDDIDQKNPYVVIREVILIDRRSLDIEFLL